MSALSTEEKLNQVLIKVAVIEHSLKSIEEKLTLSAGHQENRCSGNEDTITDHEDRLRSLESDRDKGKGGLVVVSALTGGVVGLVFAIIAKGLGL